MKLINAVFCASATLAAALPAKAADITSYTLNDVVTYDGAKITGIFRIDQTTYNYQQDLGFLAGSIEVTGHPIPSWNGIYDFDRYVSDYTTFQLGTSGNYAWLDISIPPFRSGFIDQTTGNAFIVTYDNGIDRDFVRTGNVSAVTTSPTEIPEPGTCAILLAGLLGLGFVRNKWRSL